MEASRFLSHGLMIPMMVLIAVKHAHIARERWHTGTLSAFQYRAWLRPLLSDQTHRKWLTLTLGLCAASFSLGLSSWSCCLWVSCGGFGLVSITVFFFFLHRDLIRRLWYTTPVHSWKCVARFSTNVSLLVLLDSWGFCLRHCFYSNCTFSVKKQYVILCCLFLTFL